MKVWEYRKQADGSVLEQIIGEIPDPVITPTMETRLQAVESSLGEGMGAVQVPVVAQPGQPRLFYDPWNSIIDPLKQHTARWKVEDDAHAGTRTIAMRQNGMPHGSIGVWDDNLDIFESVPGLRVAFDAAGNPSLIVEMPVSFPGLKTVGGVRYSISGSTITTIGKMNGVSGTGRIGVGRYRSYWLTPLSDADVIPMATAQGAGVYGLSVIVTTTYVEVIVRTPTISGNTVVATNVDPLQVYVTVWRA